MSAVERKPAQLVAQPLVVEHKFSDLVGELGALPLALQTAGLHAVVFSRCRPRGPDRVGRGSEFVGRHMAHELGAAAYAIRAARAAAPEDEREAAGRLECQWQRAQLPHEIRELVLDDQRLRNELCWFAFDC